MKCVETLLVIALLSVFIAQAGLSIVHKSFTYDEAAHFRYGEQILDLNSDRFDDSKMPITALNAAVYRIALNIFPDQISSLYRPERVGRLATIGFSALIGLLVYFWAREWGACAGVLALFLYVFEPNILAHSRLITTDVYVMGMVTLSVFLFWKFLSKPTLGRGALAAIAIGIAQIAKYTAIFLFPMLLFLALLYFLPGYLNGSQKRAVHGKISGFLKIAIISLVFILVSLAIINAGFLLNNTFKQFGDYVFRSSLFQSIQSRMDGLSSIPVPVPYPYLEGLDWIVHRERTGDGYGDLYLLGELREGKGFPGYFLVAMLFKLPIGLLLILVFSLVVYIKSFRWKAFFERDAFILIPLVFFLVYFNFFFRAQIGIRFLLPAFPFLIIFCGSLVRDLNTWRPEMKLMLITFLVSIIISVSSYFPHYLSYFNEILMDRSRAYEILADSNLDWGQNKNTLSHFLAENPDFIFEPEEPTAGIIVVGVNRLVGITENPETYSWLRDCELPIGNYAYSYLIFEVSADDLLHLSTCER